MPMHEGYGNKKASYKMPSKVKKGKDYKNGGDKPTGAPVDSSAKMAMQSGYGAARVKGSGAKTFC